MLIDNFDHRVRGFVPNLCARSIVGEFLLGTWKRSNVLNNSTNCLNRPTFIKRRKRGGDGNLITTYYRPTHIQHSSYRYLPFFPRKP